MRLFYSCRRFGHTLSINVFDSSFETEAKARAKIETWNAKYWPAYEYAYLGEEIQLHAFDTGVELVIV